MTRLAIVNLMTQGYSGGYRKYIAEMVPRLAESPVLAHVGMFSIQRRRIAPVSGGGVDIKVESTQHSLASAIQQWGADVVFVPSARSLRFVKLPQVLMLRNMEPHDFPILRNPPLEAGRNALRRAAAYSSCRRAAGIIAVSHHVRSLLEKRWGIPHERIETIYHGADGSRPEPSGGSIAPLPSPLIFTAGSIRPARGLEDAVAALSVLRRRGRSAHLAIAGTTDRRMEPYRRSLSRLASELGVNEHISWLGAMGTAELEYLYRTCDVFVMTTRTEACPNLALEAMRAECASVVTSAGPMVELCGDAAVYYQPGDVAALACAIGDLLDGTKNPGALSCRARDRAAGFRWDETAERTASFLARIAAQTRR